MNGIEILSSNAVYNPLFPLWVVIICAVLGALALVLAMEAAGNKNFFMSLVLGFCCICLITLAMAGRAFDNKNSINYIEHKVIISDEVSLIEFNKKYEIIEQDGEIYTVRERE